MAIDILDGDRAVAGSHLSLYGAILSKYDSNNLNELSVSLNNDNNEELLSVNVDNYAAVNINVGSRISATASLSIPDIITASPEGTDYYIVWKAIFGDNEVTSVEVITVFTIDAVEYGLEDSVSIFGSKVLIKGTIENLGSDTAKVLIYPPNTNEYLELELEETSSNSKRSIVTGSFKPDNIWLFSNGSSEEVVNDPVVNEDDETYTINGGSAQGFDLNNSYKLDLPPSLDPYTLQWYNDTNDEYIGSSSAWLINNSISQAMHEIRISVERGNLAPGLEKSALDNTEYVRFLQMGRDLFNSIEKVTEFSMTKAEDSIRRMWIICVQHEMFKSRQLQEAIKAFDFSGASTSLTIDLSQAYETMRSDTEQNIDNLIRPYKRQLAIHGILGGDGSKESLRGTPARSYGFTWSRVGNALRSTHSWRLRTRY